MQAVVLVGGKASRLRADSVEVPSSKAFMELNKRPLLYWNLALLYRAGVRSLVIVGDETKYLYEAKRVIGRLPYKFNEVIYFRDEGNGVHGVLYELRYLLHETYIFECGHGLSNPSHYKKLISANKKYKVVFSGYKSSLSNIRQPVLLRCGKVRITQTPGEAVAHPIVADKRYAQGLLRLGFSIHAVLKSYSEKKTLGYVKNELPPEYDTKDEMIEAHKAYLSYIRRNMIF